MNDDVPLLLHSLRELSSLIFPALEAAGAKDVLEIGSEAGLLTHELCEWAHRRGGSVTVIEPLPREEHRALERQLGLRLVVGKSPAALEGLARFDAYFVDGDHNYWCVSQEIRHAFAGDASPLVILHDVAWPWARRDLYYDPADIPPEHRHAFSYDGGVEPGNPGLVRGGGFRGEDAFAYARQEGGERNGVLTAVEDFLAERDDLTFLRVPVVFGLGLLFRRDAAFAPALHDRLMPFHEHPLLARMEENRIALFLQLVAGHGAAAPAETAATALLGHQQQEILRLQARLNGETLRGHD